MKTLKYGQYAYKPLNQVPDQYLSYILKEAMNTAQMIGEELVRRGIADPEVIHEQLNFKSHTDNYDGNK